MKKITIASILALLLITLFISKPNKTNAETPDVFMMNDIFLYDHDSFNFSPTFENDYLLSATILPSDVESQISAYIGWYKDLGYNQLLVPYYGDDVDNDHWVYFAIPCFDILGANFQLGYIAQTPMNLRFGVTFSDGTMQQWDTETNGFGKQILTISNVNLLKNIDAFWWEAKTADYVPSFKFLGVTDGYDIGYQNGEQNGYDGGYQVGYNLGFRNGFQDGITQAEDVVIYETVLEFNQAVKELNSTNWQSANANATFQDGIASFTSTSTNGQIYENDISFTRQHKLYVSAKIKTTTPTSDIALRFDGNNIAFTDLNTTWQTLSAIYTPPYTQTNGNIQIRDTRTSDWDEINVKNVMIIDLTRMYGEGYEPTLEQCKQIFTAEYNYTQQEPVQMGYFTGYYHGQNDGIQQGINIGESNQITMSWIQSIFSAISGVLSIQIFPKVTIGVIVGIPFVISLAWFVIRMFRGGGGGE